MQLSLVPEPIYICPVCSGEFKKDGLSVKKYCSVKCRTKHKNKAHREKNREQLNNKKKEYIKKNKDRINKQRREYRNKNKELMTERNRKWYKENPDKVKEYSLSPNRLYQVYRKNAKKRGIPFQIDFSFFMEYWGKPCSYCGENIKTIGIDRIINSLGYMEGNVTSACKRCNWAKSDMDRDTYINHCLAVALHCREK